MPKRFEWKKRPTLARPSSRRLLSGRKNSPKNTMSTNVNLGTKQSEIVDLTKSSINKMANSFFHQHSLISPGEVDIPERVESIVETDTFCESPIVVTDDEAEFQYFGNTSLDIEPIVYESAASDILSFNSSSPAASTSFSKDLIDLTSVKALMAEAEQLLKSTKKDLNEFSKGEPPKEPPKESPPQPTNDCSICLESYQNNASTTLCGHIFCTECITKTIKETRCCPICRTKLTLKKIHPIFL